MAGKMGVVGRCGVLFGAILCLLITTRAFRRRPDALWQLMQSQSVEAETPVMGRRVRGASICFPGSRAVGFGSLRNEPYPPSHAGKLTKSQGWRDDRVVDCGGKRSATPLSLAAAIL